MKLLRRIKNHLQYLYYLYLIRSNKLIKQQRINPLSIPIIIINYNQLYYLQQLVDFLIDRKFINIIIIDNKSSYPPLLDYYEQIKDKVKIEYMENNLGHMVFFENKYLQKKYGQGYYVLTDADIVPNEKLPEDFLKIMINTLDKYYKAVTKVGFALKIDDIPDYFIFKEKVITWEKKFWQIEVDKNHFSAHIDTTFALYKPNYPQKFNNLNFYKGIRISDKLTAKHGGWYKNLNNLSNEDKYYQQAANSSSSWNMRNDRTVVGDKY